MLKCQQLTQFSIDADTDDKCDGFCFANDDQIASNKYVYKKMSVNSLPRGKNCMLFCRLLLFFLFFLFFFFKTILF